MNKFNFFLLDLQQNLLIYNNIKFVLNYYLLETAASV